MTRVLVTGSTGGLGANLVAALDRRGFEVVGLRRSTSPSDATGGLQMATAVGDILDPDSLRAAMQGIDWVFHVAAIADDWHYPAEVVYRANVEGARNVLEAAARAGVQRFVLTSSGAALGMPRAGKGQLDEHDRFNLRPGDWPYGHSKQLAEETMAEFVAQGLHAVSVLPTAIMGPRDVKFISGELLVRTLKRELLPLPEGGLNFIDMRDCAEGHIAAAEKGRPGERYILGGHNMTHRETMGIISEVLGVKARILPLPRWVLPPAAGLVSLLQRLGVRMPIERQRVLLSGQFMYFDNGKAVRELGLTVRPFAESVRDAYQWYVENGHFAKRGVRVPA